jgi:hypothetical protein
MDLIEEEQLRKPNQMFQTDISRQASPKNGITSMLHTVNKIPHT